VTNENDKSTREGAETRRDVVQKAAGMAAAVPAASLLLAASSRMALPYGDGGKGNKVGGKGNKEGGKGKR
jgi:hypothetical protein